MDMRAPLGLLAELTHRCPLACPYCSNPLELEDRAEELSTAAWVDVLRQAAAMGVLQVHLSGGGAGVAARSGRDHAGSQRGGVVHEPDHVWDWAGCG
jgi:hypothetical protein